MKRTPGSLPALYPSCAKSPRRSGRPCVSFTLDVDGHREETLQRRGFIEYSWRVFSGFFILPRLGYDGYYSTLNDHAEVVTRRRRRPSFFLVFRTVEMGLFGDASYFAATANARPGSDFDKSAGAALIVHLPVAPGSMEIRPNATAAVRDDGGYQIFPGVSFIASYRRGMRDYSSLELSFPEETAWGIPWRSASHHSP